MTGFEWGELGAAGLLAVIAAVGAVLLALPGASPERLAPPRGSAGPPAGLLLRPVTGALPSGARAGVALAAAVAWAVATLSAAPWVALFSPAVAGAVYVVLGRLPAGGAARRGEALRVALPEVCTLLAVGIDAGLPLRACVAAIAEGVAEPMAGVLRRVDDRTALGATDTDAWAATAVEEPALASLAGALARSVGSGVALGGLLRDLAREARRDRQALALNRARQVGVSSVLPLMVCFLPSFFLIGVVPVIGSVLERMFR